MRLFEERIPEGRYDMQKGSLDVFKNDSSGRELHMLATAERETSVTHRSRVGYLFVMTLTTA